MSILTEPERTLQRSSEGALSWRTLAAAVRRQAHDRPDQAADLSDFADLLDALAELEEVNSISG